MLRRAQRCGVIADAAGKAEITRGRIAGTPLLHPDRCFREADLQQLAVLSRRRRIPDSLRLDSRQRHAMLQAIDERDQ